MVLERLRPRFAPVGSVRMQHVVVGADEGEPVADRDRALDRRPGARGPRLTEARDVAARERALAGVEARMRGVVVELRPRGRARGGGARGDEKGGAQKEREKQSGRHINWTPNSGQKEVLR